MSGTDSIYRCGLANFSVLGAVAAEPGTKEWNQLPKVVLVEFPGATFQLPGLANGSVPDRMPETNLVSGRRSQTPLSGRLA